MSKRIRQPAATRRAILEAAGSGFAAEGYERTGIGAIAATSGLTRGALFHHFADKEGLALAWVEELLRPQVERACIEPFRGVAGFSDWKRCWLALAGELSDGHAVSLLNRLGAEWVSSAVLGHAIAGLIERWRVEIEADIRHGRDRGWIHPSIEPGNEAGVLLAQFLGASLLISFAEEPGAVSGRFARALGSYLETLKGG